MKNVLTHGPPIEHVTLRGNFKDVYAVKEKVLYACSTFVAHEIVGDIQDNDEAEVTLILSPQHPITKALVDQFVEEQSANSIQITYNSGGNHVDGADRR